jgi:hypothetical protein
MEIGEKRKLISFKFIVLNFLCNDEDFFYGLKLESQQFHQTGHVLLERINHYFIIAHGFDHRAFNCWTFLQFKGADFAEWSFLLKFSRCYEKRDNARLELQDVEKCNVNFLLRTASKCVN